MDTSSDEALGWYHVNDPESSSLHDLLHLPADLLRGVVSHLDGICLARCARACRALRSTVDDDQLWAMAVRRRWGWLIGHGGRPSGIWRDYYVHLLLGATARFIVACTSATIDPLAGGW